MITRNGRPLCNWCGRVVSAGGNTYGVRSYCDKNHERLFDADPDVSFLALRKGPEWIPQDQYHEERRERE